MSHVRSRTCRSGFKFKGFKVEDSQFSESLIAQNTVTDEPEFEATILKEGIYFLVDWKTPLKKMRKVIREHAKSKDELNICLYLANGVEYN